MPNDTCDKVRVVEGDKMASLLCKYLQESLKNLAEAQNNLIKQNLAAGPSLLEIIIGLVQTAYANGSSTSFAKEVLNLTVKIVPTGVKHLHHAAAKYGIGVYFEANGHGTILVHNDTAKRLNQVESALNDLLESMKDNKQEIESLLRDLRQFILFLRLANQVRKNGKILIDFKKVYLFSKATGDAISNLFLTEAVLGSKAITIDEWIAFYTDLPSKTTKVKVNNKQAVICEWDEQRVKEPKGFIKSC